MKNLYAIAVMLLLAVGAYAQEGKNIYNKYSDSEGVSAVYISPAMFRLIGKIPELNVDLGSNEKMDIAPLISTLKGFYMLDVENKAIRSELVSNVEAMVKKGAYEILLEVKEEGSLVRLYTAGDEKIIESFVFVATEAEEVQFICIDGAMDRSETEALIAKAASGL